jgi:hypothetical protein
VKSHEISKFQRSEDGSMDRWIWDPSWILHGSFRLSSAEALLLEQLSLNIGVQLFNPMSKGAGLAGRGNPMEITEFRCFQTSSFQPENHRFHFKRPILLRK